VAQPRRAGRGRRVRGDPDPAHGLRDLRAGAPGRGRERLRRPDPGRHRRPGAQPGVPRGLSRAPPAPARGRVPGHQPHPDGADPAPGPARPREHGGGGRREAVDLRLARRRDRQHPHLPGGAPAPDREPPLAPGDLRPRDLLHPPRPRLRGRARPPGAARVPRRLGGLGGHGLGPGAGGGPGGGRDRAPARRRPALPGDRDPVAHAALPAPRVRGGAARARHPLRDLRRQRVLRPRGGEGRDRALAAGRGSAGRRRPDARAPGPAGPAGRRRHVPAGPAPAGAARHAPARLLGGVAGGGLPRAAAGPGGARCWRRWSGSPASRTRSRSPTS
jgi:hypothetical protein